MCLVIEFSLFIIENYYYAGQPIRILTHYDITYIFTKIDVNKRNFLDFEQSKTFLRNKYNYLTDESIKSVYDAIDTNKNDQISLDEFHKLVNQFQEQDLEKTFATYDKETKGINREDMHTLLKRFYGNLQEEHINLLIDSHDLNKDGLISYDEFKAMVYHE